MMNGGSEERFEFGLDTLLDGLAARARREGPPGPARHNRLA